MEDLIVVGGAGGYDIRLCHPYSITADLMSVAT